MSRSMKCSVFFLVFGLILLIIGCVLIPVFHNVIHNEIEEQIPLKKGSASYKAWLSPPAPIYFQVWVFDLVNPIEVTQFGAKPAVLQKGPYTYKETREKVDIVFYKNGTVSYREDKSFSFEREMSVGSENDTFTTVNLPMITIAELIRFEYDWLQELVDAVLIAVNDEELFLTLSISDILWGYEDKLLKEVAEIGSKFNHNFTFPDMFGLFYNTNGSDDGLYTIYSGSDVQGLDKFMLIDRWNSEQSLGYWSTKECNMINGTDGTMFPPFVETSDQLYIFSTDICRSIYATFDHKRTVKGIDVYRFTVPPRVFEAASENADNAGFCSGSCLLSGVLNISVCKSGAPVVISNPHFLQGDPKIINGVYGMAPTLEHQTTLDVEPMTGVVFNAQKKLQLNAYLMKVNHIKSTENIKSPGIIFPIMWLNESALIDDKSVDDFKSALLTPIKLTEAVQYGLIVIGAFLFICGLLFVIRYRMTMHKYEELVDIPNERLTNDRPPTENTSLVQNSN